MSSQPSTEAALKGVGLSLPVLLGLVTLVQALATFAVLALPTLATRAAPAYGFAAAFVGYQISVVYLAGALMSGMAGLLVRRFGAATTSCFSMALAALGLAGLASGWTTMAVLGSMLIGVAYGLTNPAASHLLFRFSSRNRQNLVFALKQTGVPAGGMLAALLLPRLEVIAGWQSAMLVGAVLIAALAGPLWLVRARIDDDRDPGARVSGGPLAGVKLVRRVSRLRAFAVMGFAYALSQFCLVAFIVTMMVEEFGWTLVAAGVLTTLTQVAGAVGRVAWSLLADKIGRGLDVLIAVGLFSALLAAIMGFAEHTWPAWLLPAILIAFGFCIIGWNGLWLAEIARASEPDQVGLATGGILVFTFLGIVVGPAAFATLYKFIGSYALTYGATAMVPLVGVLALVASRRSAGPASTPGG